MDTLVVARVGLAADPSRVQAAVEEEAVADDDRLGMIGRGEYSSTPLYWRAII